MKKHWDRHLLLGEAAEIYGLPIEKQTEQSCIEAVKKEGNALMFIQKQTSAICLEAVRQNDRALRFVKPRLKTAALCFEAIDSLCWALAYVPKKLRTYEMCLLGDYTNFINWYIITLTFL